MDFCSWGPSPILGDNWTADNWSATVGCLMTCLGKRKNGCLGMVHVPCLAYDSTKCHPPAHSHTPKEQSGTTQKQVRGTLFQRRAYKHMNLWEPHCFISSPSPNQNLLTPLPSSTPNEQPHLGNSHKGWFCGGLVCSISGVWELLTTILHQMD